MNPDDFERRLKRQAFRQVPPAWREELLSAARPGRLEGRPEPTRTWPAVRAGWRDLLWPSPRAWGGLAAAWCLILGFHLPDADRRTMPAMASSQGLSGEETAAAIREQRQLLADLMGAGEGEARTTPLREGKTIAGYPCRGYRITSASSVVDVYVTDALPVRMDAFADLLEWSGATQSLAGLMGELRRLPGFPLLTRSRVTVMGTQHETVSTVTKVEVGPLAPALFERPAGHAMPVLGNLFGTVERIGLAMGVEAGRPAQPALRDLGRLLAALREPDPPKSLRDAVQKLPQLARLAAKVFDMAPKVVSGAPCQAQVWEGKDVDLARLPVQTCWPGDAGPLITWGLTVTRGPLKPRQNLGIYRQQVIGPNRVILRWLAHRGGAGRDLLRSDRPRRFDARSCEHLPLRDGASRADFHSGMRRPWRVHLRRSGDVGEDRS